MISIHIGGFTTVDGHRQEDRGTLGLLLLSAGALAGLRVKGNLSRSLATLGCTLLTAGLAVPFAKQYIAKPAEPEVLNPEEQFEPGLYENGHWNVNR